MHITTLALLLSITGLLASFLFVGIIPSIVAFILNILCIKDEKSIRTVRSLAISFVGIILPIVMYLHSFGLSLPFEKSEKLGMIGQIVYDNYTRLGFNMGFMVKNKSDGTETALLTEPEDDEMYYVSDGVVVDDEGGVSLEKSDEQEDLSQTDNGEKIALEMDSDSIFESIDSFDGKGNGEEIKGASDDDMPSYGGLPINTLILGQYFREDDHNCNPVLVLKNQTGDVCRFECLFTARDEEGNELAASNKTVEVVKDGELFVFEGRFDKGELGGELPAMYEFLITKKEPYMTDMHDEVAVFGEQVGNSVLVTAQNTSNKRAKVDAYVLFFDGDELVDCIWMIPKNTGEVCIEPGSSAAIKGDAYYHFTRIETYYTAYEAVGE